MKHHGFALMELMLIVGLIAVIALGSWWAFGPVSTATIIERESANLVALDQAIQADYLTAQDRYQSLSAQQAVARNLAPKDWIDGPRMTSQWLGSIALEPVKAGQGFRVQFDQVPSDACMGLVARNQKLFSEIHVGGVLIYQARTLNQAALAESCSKGGEVAFDHL
ncbi:type 4 pilus major pilin [Xanthomonas axonopodis]